MHLKLRNIWPIEVPYPLTHIRWIIVLLFLEPSQMLYVENWTNGINKIKGGNFKLKIYFFPVGWLVLWVDGGDWVKLKSKLNVVQIEQELGQVSEKSMQSGFPMLCHKGNCQSGKFLLWNIKHQYRSQFCAPGGNLFCPRYNSRWMTDINFI